MISTWTSKFLTNFLLGLLKTARNLSQTILSLPKLYRKLFLQVIVRQLVEQLDEHQQQREEPQQQLVEPPADYLHQLLCPEIRQTQPEPQIQQFFPPVISSSTPSFNPTSFPQTTTTNSAIFIERLSVLASVLVVLNVKLLISWNKSKSPVLKKNNFSYFVTK